MNKDRRNLLNTLNGNYFANEEHSNNSSILSNVEVSNDDDNGMKMKNPINSDADGSLEFVGDTAYHEYAPKKKPIIASISDESTSELKRKLDTRSSKAKKSIETKSMKDEYDMEFDESRTSDGDLKSCFALHDEKATKSTASSTTQIPKIHLFHSKNSNKENVESKFDNGLEITNDRNSSNKEAILESFTIKSTSFEVENSQFSINESSEYFENSLIRKNEESKEMTEIDEDKVTTKNSLESSTQNPEHLFSHFFDSKATKLFTKMRRVKKSRPIMSTTPMFSINTDV